MISSIILKNTFQIFFFLNKIKKFWYVEKYKVKRSAMYNDIPNKTVLEAKIKEWILFLSQF